MQLDFPAPSADALAHSEALSAHVREVIAAGGGWISFAAYMREVLYAAGLGYYSAGARKFGESGDFVTAPEISPVFSQCLAGQVAQVLAELGGGKVLELGAGTGVMAADMLLELERLASLPAEYLILEPSADLRERQVRTIADKTPHLQGRVRWLDAAPEDSFCGVIVANEVVDALPAQRFTIADDEVLELGVICDGDDGFSYANRPAGAALAAAVAALQSSEDQPWPEGYTSEIRLQLPAWLAALTEFLDKGVVLISDYGYPRHEYYLPERNSGTLRCYYRHRAHDDPFVWPGLQDITAWVDFSDLAEAAVDAGFELTGYTTQANFLLASGIEERVAYEAFDAEDPRRQIEMARGLRQLLLPGEMGESVKVIALSRGEVAAPDGMFGRDMRAWLQAPRFS